MLTLTAANTIQGSATVSSAISYTISGDEVSGGSDSFKILSQGQLGTSVAVLYSVPSSTTTLVKQIILCNSTNSSVTASLFLNGSSPTNQICQLPINAYGEVVFDATGFKLYDSNGYLK